MKKILKKIVETGDVAQKEGSLNNDLNNDLNLYTQKVEEIVEEMIFSQRDQPRTHPTITEIARELNMDRRSVSRIIDQNLRPLRKRKVRELSHSNIEKRMFHPRKLLSKYTQKTLQTAFFSDENILKVKQLYNSITM